jgi:AcrR family transcriptional regulator
MTKSTSAPPAPPGEQRPQRADARRNYQRLLATARTAFAERGPEASLDDIARRAGVGSGTLYRHFPTRQALLEAVYRDQVEELCAQADELLGSRPPGEALGAWLRGVASYVATKRGLADVIGKDSEVFLYCRGRIRDAGGRLLSRAQQAGEVRADANLEDLFKLIHGISVATEQAPDGTDQADRLVALVMDGLRHGAAPL